MPQVVFLRAVNVGGRGVFRPAALAKDLAHLRVVNVGAAGTFVALEKVSAAKLRGEIQRQLRFTPEMMICAGEDVLDLAAREPFPKTPPGDGVRRMVSVLSRAPAGPPRLPLERPPGPRWQVRVVGVADRVALSFWRRDPGSALLDVNRVVEEHLGVTATSRNWNTIEKIRAILDAARGSPRRARV